MKNYLSINKNAYNALAQEYKERMAWYTESDSMILDPFIKYLSSNFKHPIRILEIGPGSGLSLSILSDKGFFVVGIDIAEKMIEIARSNCPKAILIEGDFLQSSFYHQNFEGIIAKAVIHLFPKGDAIKILNKVESLLVPHGALLLTTSTSKFSKEGLYKKEDYNNQIKRYRKYWTKKELLNFIENSKLSIYKEYYNYEKERVKNWINLITIKNNKITP